MKTLSILLLVLSSFFYFNLYAHSVQVQYCVSCNGDLRIWVEHWHGNENSASTTMTIDLTVNGTATTQTSAPGGSVTNMPFGNLPGCSTPITYVAGCPGQENTYNDWVYYDFIGLPQNAPITFTLISGNTVFTQDDCGMYPASVSFVLDNSLNLPDILLCEGESPGPIQIGPGASWTNSNSGIGLPASGNGAVQNFSPIGPPGTVATISYTTNCSSGSYDYIILAPPTSSFITESNGVATSSICLGGTFDFNDNSVAPAPDSVISWSWDFGDGNTSTLQNPSHTYAVYGTYNVELITTSSEGCNSAIYMQQVTINDTPSPNFSSTTVCANGGTTLTDISNVNGGTIANWQWDILNDNSIEFNTQNATFTFNSGGIYAVQLIAESANGCVDSITNNVTVNYLPVVDFVSDSVCLGDFTTFTDQSSVPNATISFWDWNFGAGITGISNSPTTTFPNSGNQNMDLTVTTSQGCAASLNGAAFIHALPVPNFSVEDVCVYNNISPINQSPEYNEGQVTAYTWDFGDASIPNNNQSPTHNYNNAGVYQIDLTVTSNLNCSATTTHVVNIYDKPNADFTVDTVCLETNSQYIDASNITNVVNGDNLNNWSWDVDNNLTTDYSGQNVQHIYGAEGLHNTKLIVSTTFGCSDTTTKMAIVWPLPEVDYEYFFTCLNDSTEFTDLSTISNVYTFNTIDFRIWNFADGNFCTCNDPNHLYANSGNYSTKLIATSNNGCFEEAIKIVTINPLPNPDFIADSVCVNTSPTVYTDLSTIDFGEISQWTWIFGDGNTATGEETSNYFESDGYYTTTLTVASIEGCENSITKSIRVYEIPTAVLTSEDTQGCDPSEIQFTDLSYSNSTNIENWFWSFGSGNISNQQNPNTTFSLDGQSSDLFDIELTVTNTYGCSATTFVQDYIEIFSTPIAAFTYNPINPSVSEPEVEFDNNSENADEYLWNFGNGNTSTQTNPFYMYSENEPNVYVVELIAYNNGYMCSDTAYATIQVDDVIIFYVPNAFTPDGNDYNNVWQPQFISGYDPYDYHCMVFNRWGEVVWESFDASASWNGQYSGSQIVQDGTYVWKINFKESMSAKHHQHVGHVTILQ
jgi:gliding motility-associated-like protein